MSWRCSACGQLLCGCRLVASRQVDESPVDARQLALFEVSGSDTAPAERDASRLEQRRADQLETEA